MARATKYKSGQFYRHKKHGFVIQLAERRPFGRFSFEVIKGEIPLSCSCLLLCNEYSTSALYSCFDAISGRGAEILFGQTQGIEAGERLADPVSEP